MFKSGGHLTMIFEKIKVEINQNIFEKQESLMRGLFKFQERLSDNSGKSSWGSEVSFLWG